jgi:UDP:flavonoid glycosyltransferase YjiC (YdhE family)
MRRHLRVLCTSTPGTGHITALAPVANALRDRGHEVSWAVAPEGGAAMEAMGFEWSPAGISVKARRESAADVLDEIMQLPMAERRGPLFAALFARGAGPVMQRDLTPIIDRVRPDVVVREPSELAAAPMAAARGIPLVTVAFSGVLPEGARRAVLDDLGPLWLAEGLSEPSWEVLYGDLYLHPFPVSFGQRPDAAVVRPIRRERGVPSAVPPPWVAALGTARPIVYVTSGTEVASASFPWHEVFAATAGMDVDVVATIGNHVDPADLGTVPASIRIERFVDQADLLPRASAVVSHGGAGTVLGAAAHGRPQVVVPLFADQWENGVAVTDAGCGSVLEPGRRSVGDFDLALRRLLGDRSHAAAAARVAQEIEAMPSVDDVATEIEALAGN